MANNDLKRLTAPEPAENLRETEPENLPADFDQYESPTSYEYEDALPDDADTIEQEVERDGWR